MKKKDYIYFLFFFGRIVNFVNNFNSNNIFYRVNFRLYAIYFRFINNSPFYKGVYIKGKEEKKAGVPEIEKNREKSKKNRKKSQERRFE